MRALLNTKMVEGTPVRDHVLKMISHLNELEILGAEIDDESQVDIRTSALIKEAIPWQNFLKNYRQQRGSLAKPRVCKLWRKGFLHLLQRRTRRRERLLNLQEPQSRKQRKVMQSLETSASPAVK